MSTSKLVLKTWDVEQAQHAWDSQPYSASESRRRRGTRRSGEWPKGPTILLVRGHHAPRDSTVCNHGDTVDALVVGDRRHGQRRGPIRARAEERRQRLLRYVRAAPTATSVTLSLTPDHTYRFRMRAGQGRQLEQLVRGARLPSVRRPGEQLRRRLPVGRLVKSHAY